ncbi:sulfonate transport system ATP-binding protein [Thermoflavimicrobium dichotomicum]|uniref:Sulfonate transport system ATP-binding protein n=1 Tax=Thermoflavimicrobium dichotomicum TaxID=46223 RepID=A0A1I3RTV1_9BACL|nr:ATP-binding cassette domain-containing protein [Thermoflavimicrobium dichotomicum]SFJ49312.1 sulfonate transport system ATP-binding protein [Thermoflavimicrobium dichotomicum]
MSTDKGLDLSIRSVTKHFGQLQVLKGIDLEIEPGEFVAIVGRSGCGKSTLLRLIAGLEEPTDGEILIDNQKINGVHKEIRVLFQDARLLPWKKVLDNVRIGVRSGSIEIAREALQEVGLADRAEAWPSVLSGGQKQRVALARALAGKPKLLLLDEPLGALDALTRIKMQSLIEKLWREQKFTSLLVTHDVTEAVTLADRIIMIEEGRVALDLRVPLPRPRERNSHFLQLEKVILSKLLVEENDHIDSRQNQVI